MHCFLANSWYRSKNLRAVCVFVSPVLIPSSANRRLDHFHPTRYLSHSPAGIFYCMPLRKIITQRNFLCLWSKIIRKASLTHHNFFSFKETKYKSVRWILADFNMIFGGFKFAYKTTKFYVNDLCATSDKNTNFNISKNLLRKVGISNSLSSRTV